MKKYLFIGLLIVLLCAAGIFYFLIFPAIMHQMIIESSKNYQPETLISFDGRFSMQTLKYEEETGTYAGFAIDSCSTGERLFLCPDKYRTMDLKSISWEGDSYTVTVVSGDVGTFYYCFAENTWIKNSEKNINWSVSKYSEITSRHYEETPDGCKAGFYEKAEIDIARISEWLAACEPSGGYYHYIYSDPDSWDMFIYYPVKNNSNEVYKSFKFCVVEKIVRVYVESNEASFEEPPSEYILLRIQAHPRGVWPSGSALFINGREIMLGL